MSDPIKITTPNTPVLFDVRGHRLAIEYDLRTMSFKVAHEGHVEIAPTDQGVFFVTPRPGNEHGPYCDHCGDCMTCYGEDQCVTGGRHSRLS